MNKIKIGWGVVLLITFLLFSSWYGGHGKPITAEEGVALLAELDANYANLPADERSFASNMRAMIPNDDGKEFYAVNLERLIDSDAAREADAKYARVVFPQLFKRAGHPVFVSERAGLMLGDYGEQVDRVAVVRYRSLRDLIDMVNDPAMQAGGHHKFDAIEHTEVFITRPVISFIQIRLIVALILILFGLAGLKIIDWIANRTNKTAHTSAA